MKEYLVTNGFFGRNEEANRIEETVIKLCKKYGHKKASSCKSADFAIAIGGDGTFIDTANAVGPFVPIIGINKGKLGYLTELEPADVKEKLEQYLANDGKGFNVERRMKLEADWIGANDEACTVHALNDIVITKSYFSVIYVDIIVDGKLLTGYYADGIIVSTPTGATGYSLSCGGPIVDPTSEMIIITPIAPHSIMSRSIVLSASSVVEIVIKEGKGRGGEIIDVSHDGKKSDTRMGSSIMIKKAQDDDACVVRFNEDSFYQRLLHKMLV